MKKCTVTLLGLVACSFVHAAANENLSEPVPTFADVKYGSHERNALDFWQAEGEGPRPVNVYIHGGGWVGGEKSSIKKVQQFLDRGISVVSINYRRTGVASLPAPVLDAVRAVQFIRYKAGEWNIDPEKVVVSGVSAGGCSSLWIACHEDLANPNSDDPVERESSRVFAAATGYAQSSIDPKQIEPWIGPFVFHQMIYKAVGEKSIASAQKNYEKHAALYKEFSPINHYTADDPPIYMQYNGNLAPPEKYTHGIHHAMFGVKMREKSEQVGHKELYLTMGREKNHNYTSLDDFIIKILLGEQ